MGRRIRQKDILPEEALMGRTIHIVGCGAIGSFVALSVGKMAGPDVNMILWDPDTVSDENLAVQFYRIADLGRPKAEALADIVQQFDGPKAEARVRPLEEGDILSGIVLSCVDSMDARRLIFKAAFDGGAAFLVDGRMGAEVVRVFSCDLADEHGEVPAYVATLRPGPVMEEPCTAKAIIYTVEVAAGVMVAMLKEWLSGIDRPGEVAIDLRYLQTMISDPVPKGERVAVAA